MHQGGVYANGQVVVQPLPAAIYGDTTERTVPLRRLEAVLTEEELHEHSSKEMQKVSHNSCSTAVCEQCGCCTSYEKQNLLPLQDHLTHSCIADRRQAHALQLWPKMTCSAHSFTHSLHLLQKVLLYALMCQRLSDTWLMRTGWLRHQAL